MGLCGQRVCDFDRCRSVALLPRSSAKGHACRRGRGSSFLPAFSEHTAKVLDFYQSDSWGMLSERLQLHSLYLRKDLQSCLHIKDHFLHFGPFSFALLVFFTLISGRSLQARKVRPLGLERHKSYPKLSLLFWHSWWYFGGWHGETCFSKSQVIFPFYGFWISYITRNFPNSKVKKESTHVLV